MNKVRIAVERARTKMLTESTAVIKNCALRLSKNQTHGKLIMRNMLFCELYKRLPEQEVRKFIMDRCCRQGR